MYVSRQVHGVGRHAGMTAEESDRNKKGGNIDEKRQGRMVHISGNESGIIAAAWSAVWEEFADAGGYRRKGAALSCAGEQ